MLVLVVMLTIVFTNVHSGSLCTCGNRDNFRITESISKILGPERSP